MTRDSTPSANRRQLLAVLGTSAVTTGLAGCLGGNGGNGDEANGDQNGDDSNGNQNGNQNREDANGTENGEANGGQNGEDNGDENGTAEEPAFCQDITAEGYSRYDEPESPFVATFEQPGNINASATVNNVHSLTVTTHVGEDGQRFHVFPAQMVVGTESRTDVQRGDVSGVEQVDEFEYGGETVPLVRAEPAPNGDDNQTGVYLEYPYYIAGLPHEGSSGTRYYRMDITATVQFADGLEAPVCSDTFEQVARHMMYSLEPNPDTTVEERGVE